MSFADSWNKLREDVASLKGEAQEIDAPTTAGMPRLGAVVPVKFSSNASGGGIYIGSFSLGAPSVNDTQQLSLSGFEDGPECVIVNAEEAGLPTHWIKSGEYQLARFVAVDSDDGRPVLMVDGAYYRTASASTLSSGMTNGAGATADPHYWNRDETASGNKYGDCPIEVTVLTGFGAYSSGGSANFNIGSRVATWDAGGKCWKWSAETKATTITFDLDEGMTFINDGNTYNNITSITVANDGPTFVDNGGGSITLGPSVAAGDGLRFKRWRIKIPHTTAAGAKKSLMNLNGAPVLESYMWPTGALDTGGDADAVALNASAASGKLIGDAYAGGGIELANVDGTRLIIDTDGYLKLEATTPPPASETHGFVINVILGPTETGQEEAANYDAF